MSELVSVRVLGDPANGVLLVLERGRPGQAAAVSVDAIQYVPEVTVHGVFLDVLEEDRDFYRELAGYEQFLIRSISRAAVSLGWLHTEDARTRLGLDIQRAEHAEDYLDPTSAMRQRDDARRLREASIPTGLSSIERQRMARRLAIASGEIPGALTRQFAEMHRENFVLAVLAIHRTLTKLQGVLRDADQKKKVGLAQKELLSRVGDLSAVRDSLHHPEDRMVGKGRGASRRAGLIDPQPIEKTGIIEAPQGAVVSGSIDGELFLVTAGDGAQSEIKTTEDALLAAVEAVQAGLNAMPRRGQYGIQPY